MVYIGATVALESTSLETTEGGTGANTTTELCVILTNAMGGLERDVVLSLNTLDGTAIGRCSHCVNTTSTCKGTLIK